MLRILNSITICVIMTLSSVSMCHDDEISKKELLLQAARNSAKAGDIDLATDRFEKYLELEPNDAKAAIEFASFLKTNGNDKKAKRICNLVIGNIGRMISDNLSQPGFLLDMAHLYSWQKEYDTASAYYDDYLLQVPNDKKAMLEQARIEEWNQNYKKSSVCYERLVKSFPQNKEYRYEYLAKKNSWRGWNINAIKNYEKALRHSPNDTELLYSLGKAYDWRGLYPQADSKYLQILEQNANHSMVHIARLSEEFRQKQYVKLDTKYTRKKGRDDNVDHDSYSVLVKYSPKRKLGGAEFTVGGGYTYLNLSGTKLNAATVTATYKKLFTDSISFLADAAVTNYSRLPHQTFQYDIALNYKPCDFFELRMFNGHQDITENINVMFDELNRHYIGTQFTTRPFAYCTAYLNAKKYWYSDGNSAYEYEGTAEYEILRYPHILKTVARHYGFDTASDKNTYWTPDNYNRNSIGLSWYHYLNQHDYSDLYYYLQGHLLVDRSGNNGQEIVAGIIFDNKRALNFGLEYSASFSSVYDQSNINAYLQYKW